MTDRFKRLEALGLIGCLNDSDVQSEGLKFGPLPQWICVKEKMPGDLDHVLIALNYKRGFPWGIAFYSSFNNKWTEAPSLRDFSKSEAKHITHWMSLPEPPK